MSQPRIAFVSSKSPLACAAMAQLCAKHASVPFEEADIIVALGGDGLMLETLHRVLDHPKPIYGMNRGSVGFLMNEFSEDALFQRLREAKRSIIHPLRLKVWLPDGKKAEVRAINEVSLLRRSGQAAKLAIHIDGELRLSELTADGILVATPCGSTAYNLSANGPILPLKAPLLALTPLSPFRPRRWRGALLPNTANMRIEVLDPERRPVSAYADHSEYDRIEAIEISADLKTDLVLLHDSGHSLDERILREQFGF